MPIPRRNFDAQIGPIAEAVLRLLSKNPEAAFSYEEIAFHLRANDLQSRSHLTAALNDLLKGGRIEGRMLDGLWYCSINLKLVGPPAKQQPLRS